MHIILSDNSKSLDICRSNHRVWLDRVQNIRIFWYTVVWRNNSHRKKYKCATSSTNSCRSHYLGKCKKLFLNHIQQ